MFDEGRYRTERVRTDTERRRLGTEAVEWKTLGFGR